MIFSSPIKTCFAENGDNSNEKVEQELNQNIDKILGDIDSDELDEYITNDFNLEFLDSFSFLSLVRAILSNNFFTEYKSLFNGILDYLKQNFKSLFIFFFSLFVIVIISEMFNSFCIDKYKEIKKLISIIFSLVLAVLIIVLIQQTSKIIIETTNKIFDFSKKLMPILLSLILLTGSNGTYTIYQTLSVFLIETGMYIFIYILMPIVSSIVLLTVLGVTVGDNKFSNLISLLKTVFKYIIIGYYTVFGLFSTINLVTSGISDGVNYKLTKFAIKSYIPVLGGYISDGFDFVHTCSVLVKNSFGITGILVLFFMVLKPILLCIVYILMFKILGVATSFVGKSSFAKYFENISNSIKYFMAILASAFMCVLVFIYLLIMSVSVV